MENKINIASKLEDYRQMINLLTRNIGIVNKVSRFQVAVSELNSNQKKLEALLAVSAKDLTGIENDKNSSRIQLEESAIAVVRVLQIFAHDREKRNLQREIYHVTAEFVKNCIDTDLIKISKRIWLILNKYGEYSPTFINRVKALLKPDDSKDTVKFEKEYGLSRDRIKQLEDAMIRFIENMLLFENELKIKEEVEIKIKKINKKIKKLLVNKIDRFVLLFEHEEPVFYDEYKKLRANQFPGKVKESLAQESDPIEELKEAPVKKVKQKAIKKKQAGLLSN